ncbi:MAG: acetolactate synthase large subunit [Myxococcales bacterium]|nr:acetolactate synthase large subunit [Myxococcales bacterium]
MTNGAVALLETLRNAGVDTCFMNPGTSEMHFVSALDGSDMRAVLALFEGVATGAADGYARIAQKPAATLLHLGCGLGNGLANLHNARKARVPLVNIVGDHATYHTQYDAQLQSDIETVARNVSTWVRTTARSEDLARDALEAVSVAIGPPAQVTTLILPADVSWTEGARALEPKARPEPACADDARIDRIARTLGSGDKTAILLGRRVLLERGLVAASKIAERTGAKLFCEVFPTRLERGAGLPNVERLAYFAELASVQLAGFRHLVLIDAKAPVSFFGYPGKKSYLVPEGCELHDLVRVDEDAVGSIERLVRAVGAERIRPRLQPPSRPQLPTGKLTGPKVCQALGALLPSDAIISDEAQTSGVKLGAFTQGCPRHDLLALTGGAIGQALPVAVGAAIAAPERPVVALVGDGSAMYTLQALWSIVREGLDVTTIIMNNRAYSILNIELSRVGAEEPGPKAKAQLDLASPPLDFVKLAQGMGMRATRATTAEEFTLALRDAFTAPGPRLIDAIIPSEFDGLKLRALPTGLDMLQRLPSPLAKGIKKKLGL